MGEISEDALHGIITHMDDKYNYVWSNQHRPSELRYPINPACKFKLGEVVGYIKSFDVDRVQPAGDHLMQLGPEKQRYELVRPRPESGMIKWKVKIPVTFAPENSDVYRQIVANDDKQKVKSVANNRDFSLVVFPVTARFDMHRTTSTTTAGSDCNIGGASTPPPTQPAAANAAAASSADRAAATTSGVASTSPRPRTTSSTTMARFKSWQSLSQTLPDNWP